MSEEWGRVDPDGTVYVRTAEGERAVGSWRAGPPEAGLEHFRGRFAQLEAQVELLLQRAAAEVASPAALRDSARRLLSTLPTAAAVGDFDALAGKLNTLLERLEEKVAASADARRAARAAAGDRLQALVEEAESLAASTSWKASGERLQALSTEWTEAARAAGTGVASRLWPRVAAANRQFARRRREYFAERTRAQGEAKAAKEAIIAEAEELADTDDWARGSAGYRDLMNRWKAAGRAGRGVEEALWERYKTAQDRFFARRAEANAARTAEFDERIAAKRAIIAEAEGIDLSDPPSATRHLRDLQQRFDKVGTVPREANGELERSFVAAAARVRAAAAEARRPDPSTSPLVTRLRESVEKLQKRAERARAAGREDEAAEAEAALATQREWLERAERA